MATEGKGNLKQKTKEQEKKSRSYWSKDGQVFFAGGHAWGLYLVEIPSTNGRKCYEAKHVCLGKEEGVLAVLDAEPMPDTLTPVQREVLTKIVDNVGENKRSSRYDDRTQGFSFRKRARRSFRDHYRYSA
jgi:hypothetical protein